MSSETSRKTGWPLSRFTRTLVALLFLSGCLPLLAPAVGGMIGGTIGTLGFRSQVHDGPFEKENTNGLILISGRLDMERNRVPEPGELHGQRQFAILARFDPRSGRVVGSGTAGAASQIRVWASELFPVRDAHWYEKNRPKGRLTPILLVPGHYALHLVFTMNTDWGIQPRCVHYPSGEHLRYEIKEEGYVCPPLKVGTKVKPGTPVIEVKPGRVSVVGRLVINNDADCPIVGIEREQKYVLYELQNNRGIAAPLNLVSFNPYQQSLPNLKCGGPIPVLR